MRSPGDINVLYLAYQMQEDLIAPLRQMAAATLAAQARVGASVFPAQFAAGLEMLSRYRLTHTRPPFDIHAVQCGNQTASVTERVALSLPFGNLLHFKKDIETPQPRVLVIAPLSGHFSTLLAGTVRTLLSDHDVYLTDWANARDVPVSAGGFGVDDYVSYLIRFLEEIGPGAHILAVCQPCVQALVAASVMAAESNPAAPRSMTLMAGPIDPRESPTTVNELAVKKALSWFENNLIAQVPGRFGGATRKVYPGFLQLVAFMSMNIDRHREAHRKMYRHLAAKEYAEAERIKTFYDEYFAVLDLPAEFYIETVDRVFHRADLANGSFTYRGQLIDPAAIRRTALLTVEGGRDDICGLGQTAAAHDLCRSLRPHLKRHHLQANVGHYGTFNGKRWEREIYPVVKNFILAME